MGRLVVRDSRRRERRDLRVNPRVFMELGMIYSSPLDFFREFIQNAIDADATEIRFTIGPGYVVAEHNGKPIEDEYLDAFLEVGTDFKARGRGRDRYVGMYGIGRLSWVMLGKKSVIETGNKRLIWDADALGSIEIENTGRYVDGVRWVIELKDDVKIDPEEVAIYLARVYHGDVPVYVNGKTVGKKIEKHLILDDGVNRVYYTPSHEFSYKGEIIKGIFSLGSIYNFPKLIIYTNDPRVRMNPAREIIYDYKFAEWKREVMRKILSGLKSRYTPMQVARVFGMDTVNVWARNLSFPENIKYMLFNTSHGVVWGDAIIKNPQMFVWKYSDEKISDTARILLEKNGLILVNVHDRIVGEQLGRLGVRHVSSVVLEHEAKVVSDDLGLVLEQAFNNILDAVEKEVLPTPKTQRQEVKIEYDREKDSIEVKLPPSETGGKYIPVVKARIVGEIPSVKVVVAEVDDEDVVAFTDGKKVYINIKSPVIKRLLEETVRYRNDINKITLLWAPIMVHEYCHMLGLDHTHPLWNRMYEEVMMKVIMRTLRKM